jgi:hypothetical protein
MVQREESRRFMMNTKSHEPGETKIFAIRHPKPNSKLDVVNEGYQTFLRCDHCKREGHKEEDCCSSTQNFARRGKEGVEEAATSKVSGNMGNHERNQERKSIGCSK